MGNIKKNSEKMSTRETILKKATELYNLHGVEYVGIRELAKELNIKAGNITYYFPTKNHLIAEVANRCTESSTGIINIYEGMSVYEYLQMLQHLFHSQSQYRSLLLSLPHLVREIDDINNHYREAQKSRKEIFSTALDILCNSGSLKECSAETKNFFTELMLMILRFWISDNAVNESIGFENTSIYRHIFLVADFLSMISTPKGLQEINEFKKEIKKMESRSVLAES
jgi:AcrR family transcriptional regulator